MTTCSSCGVSSEEAFRFCPSCGVPCRPDEKPGDPFVGVTLGGKYRVIEAIGEGGMGRVYLAEHVSLRKKVAIKALHPDLHLNVESLRRFQREGIAAGSFEHVHAVQVFDFDRADDGRYYLAMEFVDGPDLKGYVTEHGAIDPELAVHWTLQILEVLEEAHSKGAVHRDLKPDNVMVVRGSTDRPMIKVLDFGLSKLVGDSTQVSMMTQTGRVIGSPLYMAPEQWRGDSIDHRIDLYATGVMLFEMLVGKPPYEGNRLTELMVRSHAHDTPSVAEAAPSAGIPADLEAVVAKAMETDPEARYQTAEEMTDALEEIDWRRSAKARGTKRRPAARRRTITRPQEADTRPGWIVPAAIAGAVMLGVAVWLWSSWGGGGTPPSRVRMIAAEDRTSEQVLYVDRLDTARRALANRSYRTALDSAESAMTLPCSDAEAHQLRGAAFAGLGDTDTALNELDRAAAADPGFAEPLATAGWIHLERGSQDKAQESFDAAYARDEGHPEALAGIGYMAWLNGDSDAALKSLDQAIENDSNAWRPHQIRGQVHLHTQNTESAIADFVEAKRLGPKSNIEPMIGLGDAYVVMDRRADAEAQYREGARFADANEAPNVRLAALSLAAGNPASAKTIVQAALRFGGSAEFSLLDGLLAQTDGDHSRALDAVQTACKDEGVDHTILRLLGDLYQLNDRDLEAIGAYDRAVAANATDHEAWLQRGLVMSRIGRTDEAETSFATALEHREDHAPTHFARGVLRKDYFGDVEGAKASFSRYRELGGNDPRAIRWLAEHN